VGEQKKGRRITNPEEIEALRQVRERARDIPGRTELQVIVWRKGEEGPWARTAGYPVLDTRDDAQRVPRAPRG
jgi:hypothetical protein